MTRAAQIECLLQPVIDHRTQAIASGYTVEFYSAGTSTAKNIWDEKEKTTPHTSVTLGSDGTYQAYGDGIYDIFVKDADDTTVYEWTYLKIQANTYTSQAKVANYTATPDDDVVLCNGTFTVSIQNVTLFTHPLIIKNVGSGTITVDPYSTQTIDGDLTITLSGEDDDAVLYPYVTGEVWYRANRFQGLVALVADLNRISGGYLHDDDDDTKVQVEESADEDKVRVDVGGVEKVLISGTATESYMQVNSHRDADGDTKIQVEESADEDKVRIDIAGTERVVIDTQVTVVGEVEATALDVNGNADISGTTNLHDVVTLSSTHFSDGTNSISFPTNGMAAAKFMLGNSDTIAWFYNNTAPPGWKVLATGADTVLGVSGGAQAYNVNGGNQAGTWTLSGLTHAHTHTNGAHVHQWYDRTTSGAEDRTFNSGGSATAIVSGGKQDLEISVNTGDVESGIDMDCFTSSVGGQTTSGASTNAVSSDATWRASASVGKLFQLDSP